MDAPQKDQPSAGAQRFSDVVRDRLHASDFAETLRVRLLEQNLRTGMLGLAAAPVRLGRWELRAAIDQGAMGAVFRAFDPLLRCEVAIKLLVCPDGADLRERRARMESEAQAMAQLRHPNVLRVQNFVPASTDEEGAEVPSFLVMDFVEGTTLLQWQREAPGDWRGIVEKYAQVAAGLAHIHASNLVHRDIKPANILVRRSGEAVIGDFGLVHEADREAAAAALGGALGDEGPLTASDRLTQQGAILGTLAYMAPEQLRDGTTSARSDQFSFFVALYEALYGRLPFAGEARSDLLESMLRGHLVLDHGLRRAPRWLRRLMARGLAVDPAERHPSMEMVASALVEGLKPRDHGRLWTLAGGMVVGAALIFAVVSRGAEDPCRDADELVGWSKPRQAAAQAAFLTSGVEGAEGAWRRFHDRVDRVARSWKALKRGTCEVLEARGEGDAGDAELALRRDACLGESAALLAKFTGRYRRASAKDVLSSEDAAFELEEGLRRCERGVLLRRAPEPRGSVSSDAHEQVRDGLATAMTLELGGALVEAAAVAEEVLEAATRLGDPGLEAQASFRLGRIRSLLRQDDAAVDLFDRAFALANANLRDDVAADALIELIKALTLDVGDLRRAADLEEMVESFVVRLGGDDTRRAAAAAEALGILALEQGRRGDAIEHHRRALGMRRSQRDTPTSDHVRSHVNLANALTAAGHDDAALAEARGLYEQAIARALTLGESHPVTASARRDYATFLWEDGELAGAQREAEASLAAVRRVYGDDSREAAVLHVLLGTLAAMTLGEAEETSAASLAPARAHVQAALQFFERAFRPRLVDRDHIAALHLSAELHRSADEVNEAIADYERALAILHPSADHQELLADTLGYLGELLVDAERPAEALPRLREAWELITLLSSAPQDSHARLLSAMAVAQVETGDLPGGQRTAREAEALAGELDLDGETLALLRSRLDPILNNARIKEDKKENRNGSL